MLFGSELVGVHIQGRIQGGVLGVKKISKPLRRKICGYAPGDVSANLRFEGLSPPSAKKLFNFLGSFKKIKKIRFKFFHTKNLKIPIRRPWSTLRVLPTLGWMILL